MSYTSSERVRDHLVVEFGSADQVFSLPFIVRGNDNIVFFAGGVDPDSVRVKSVRQTKLSRSELTLLDEGNVVSLSGIQPGSVTLASDSSLGQLYTENVDFYIDYAAGKLFVKAGGALSAGMNVTIWQMPYSLYVEGVDYRIDSEKGELARYVSGGIADGELVWLDFTPRFSSFTDEIISAAVRDANGLIEREVDPAREFGADPVLVSVATYRALEIVCRAAAARELASQRGQDRIATSWMKLGDDYARLAERWIKSFHPPIVPPASPALS